MSKTNPHLNCPGGEIVHPLLSRNPADVRCHIQGGLRPAKGSPCCNDYANCSIYKAARRVEVNKRMQRKQVAQTIAKPRPDVGSFTRSSQ